MNDEVFRHGEVKLTGIKNLKNKYKNGIAVICCSGTTLSNYEDKIIPKEWTRFAVNEAIRKLNVNANFWVLSDDEIIYEYSSLCPQTTTILCMHEGTRIIHKYCKRHTIYTVDSLADAKDFDNGYQFYSRGTVMIGAIEMARYMGFNRFFIFGLDCYRLKSQYYYDERRPLHLSENSFTESQKVRIDLPADVRIYVTPRLRNMIDKLNLVSSSGIWPCFSARARGR